MVSPVVWQYVGIGATAFALVMLGLLVYNRREKRRYKAAAVAGELEKWGLTKLAGVFRAYAVGDYSGLVKAVDALYDKMTAAMGGPGSATIDLLTEAFWKMLAHFLGDGQSRQRIREMLDAADSVAQKRAAGSATLPAETGYGTTSGQ